MLLIVLATASALGFTARQFGSRTQAVFCSATFLLMPATFRFGLLALPVNLVLLSAALALLLAAGYLRDEDRGHRLPLMALLPSSFLMFLGVGISWEAALLLPGVLAAWLIRRDVRIAHVFVAWSLACGLGLMTVGALYAASDASFLDELWKVFRLRAGLADYAPPPSRIHLLENERLASVSLLQLLRVLVIERFEFIQAIGVIGLCLLPFALVGRGTRRLGSFGTVAVLAFASIWIGWVALMKEHFVIHDYQMVIASPILAIGISELIGLVSNRGAATSSRYPMLRVDLLATLGVLYLLILAAAGSFATIYRWHEPLIEFGRDIRRNVPDGSLVLTDQVSMVPVYYAQRHILRGIADEMQIRRQIGDIRRLCRSCATYLAIPPASVARFNSLIAETSGVIRDQDTVIVPLP